MADISSETVNDIVDIMEYICTNARDAANRAARIERPERMSDDDFKALAKEVEEVGESVRKLEQINPYIVPALFEVPHGKWMGWSGLQNYRNVLAHDFPSVTPSDLFDRVTNKLALTDVVDLLSSVTSVSVTDSPFSFGLVSDVRRLQRSQEYGQLHPGASLILLRFDPAGELMAARSWRDADDNWCATTRWVRTYTENQDEITLSIRDTEMHVVPRPLMPDGRFVDDEELDGEYNLFVVPTQPFAWVPKVTSQQDSFPRRKKR